MDRDLTASLATNSSEDGTGHGRSLFVGCRTLGVLLRRGDIKTRARTLQLQPVQSLQQLFSPRFSCRKLSYTRGESELRGPLLRQNGAHEMAPIFVCRQIALSVAGLQTSRTGAETGAVLAIAGELTLLYLQVIDHTFDAADATRDLFCPRPLLC